MIIQNTMRYRGYTGSVEFSEEDNLLFGKVLGIRSLILYEGTTGQELCADFHGAVDDYLAVCEAEGVEPDVPYKGTFNVRVSPALHEQLARYAIGAGRSLNSCVQEALERYVATVVAG